MHWLFLIAVFLGLTWFSSDRGQCLIEVGLCVLSFLAFSVKRNRTDHETGTQTDTLDSTPIQTSTNDHVVFRDEPDTAKVAQKPLHRLQCPNVWKSLHNMFKCAYTHLVLPWYTVPEPRDHQPLHAALLTEFDFITDRIIGKAMNFNLSVVSVNCIRIFTQHLHNAKQSHGFPAYSCSADEMAVLRDFAKALVHNLFPEHLWEQGLYCCALQEILATRVQALVTLLSDPYNLNCLVVSQLGGVVPECSEKEVQQSDAEGPLLSLEHAKQEGVNDQPAECSADKSKAKKKVRKLKERFSNFWGNLKPKKSNNGQMEGEEEIPGDLPPRKCAMLEDIATNSDGAPRSESSICASEECDVESDGSTPPEEMMEFKLSYEMWRAGKWTVRVTNVQVEDEELCFTVHLKECDSPENLHWDVKKTQADIVEFYTHCKDTSHLPSISTILDNTQTVLNEDFKDEVKTTLEKFLQELVADTELGDTQLVFKFLCPLHQLLNEEERGGGVWSLLGSLASFLTVGQEDDELNNLKAEEKPDKNLKRNCLSEATPHCDVTRPGYTETVERHSKEPVITDCDHRSSSDDTYTCASEKQATDCSGSLLERPEVDSTGSAGVCVHLVSFPARTKRSSIKIQPAALCDSDSDSLGYCALDSITDCSSPENASKKENLTDKLLQSDKPKGKDKAPQAKEDILNQRPEQDKMSIASTMENPDVNKVIFGLLKEISGNSHIFKIMKAVLLPFMPLIKKKVNTFLKMMTPSEAQIAVHIDNLCKVLWTEGSESLEPPKRSEEEIETKGKAMHLIVSKLAGYPILNKADLENMFKIFQEPEENKKLIYMLLVYLLREFLPGESFPVMSKLNVKDSV
ncbi:uncharacterized protein si:rp71-46j2.7 isoform X2 [Electrophorus electricus]|uniref:uncharacterized protein si:rp71-46j2.7 isoform X2 n=1 Tax=Electrophorus electricus TaxID=8005 RepID=UPI0015CFE4FC|nr:uncharacterized protein si:rp71-46j2.7 isoform X2 [Electrophorus electricus]